MQFTFVLVQSGGPHHFECEYDYENAKTEMKTYTSNFRTLIMQFWPPLKLPAAILDSITIYISVTPLKIKGQRLFEFHVIIKKTKKTTKHQPTPHL